MAYCGIAYSVVGLEPEEKRRRGINSCPIKPPTFMLFLTSREIHKNRNNFRDFFLE